MKKNNLILQRWSKCKAVFLEVKDKNYIKRGLLLKENPCTFLNIFFYFFRSRKNVGNKRPSVDPETRDIASWNRVRPETRRQTSLSEFEKLTPEILVDDEVSDLKTFMVWKVEGSNP